MRFSAGLVLFLCARLLCAQSDDDPEVVRARAGIENLRALVAAGAAPRSQLDKAEDAIADARDSAILRKTLYGAELTDQQLDEMIAASERRLERRRRELSKAQEMVKAGVATQLSLGTFLEEVDRSRREYDLAASRARLWRELAEMAKAEQALESKLAETPLETHSIAERFDGDGVFTSTDFRRVALAFEGQFSKPLPVSAQGETAVHRALGFDHRNRVDVAIHPDQPEGVWLRRYLTRSHIPFFAFRQAVPGKATGAHIHIGPMSSRVTHTD